MKYLIRYMIIFFISAFVFSCGKNEKNNMETNSGHVVNNDMITPNDLIKLSKDQFNGDKMKLAKIEKKLFPKSIITTGMIDVPPNSRAIISAFAGGYIKNTPLLIGDKVKKGQPLVTIENMEFVEMQQEYLEVWEQLNYLTSEYDRQKVLFAENISSEKSFLNAENNLKITRAKYNGLRKKLEMLNISPEKVENGNISSVVTIYAPINGSITAIHVSTGTYVSPSNAIMEIVNTDQIHLELKVFEKDILKLKEGQKVTFKIPEYLNEVFEGEVHLIGRSIDENRTIQVHAHMNEDGKYNFIVGMFVEARIITEEILASALPEEAIIEMGDKNYVLLLHLDSNDNYTFSQKEVSIENAFGGYIKISDSKKMFKEKDLFLVGGTNLIVDE